MPATFLGMHLVKSTQCSYLWSHVCLLNDGNAIPCCNWTGVKTALDPLQTLQGNLETGFADIRARMSRDERVAGCKKCYDREAFGGKSMRTHFNEIMPIGEKPILRSVEFDLGNLCNLKCLHCNSTHSTKWGGPLKKPSLAVMEGSWENLERVKFIGGEPLMVPEHEKFLEKLTPEKMTLEYSTNGTIRPRPRVMEFWRRVKALEVAFSIDGLKEANDFFREGSRWQEIIENIRWFRAQLPRAKFRVHTVVNVHNAHQIWEIDEWLHDEFPGMELTKDCLISPKHLDARQRADRFTLAQRYDELKTIDSIVRLRRNAYGYIGAYLRSEHG